MKPVAKKVALGLLAAAVVCLLYPIEQTIAPDWQVTVVDEKGVRLAGIHVRESWRQHSLQDKPAEQVLQTDSQGAVHFPRRTATSNLFRRAIGCWDEYRKQGKAASCGPHASIWAFGPGLGTLDAHDSGGTTPEYVPREIAPDLSILPDAIVQQQTTMILLHHCPPGYFGAGCKMTESYAPTESKR
jgi:hypothetical protein